MMRKQGVRFATKADLDEAIGSVRQEIGYIRQDLESKASKTDLSDLGKAIRVEMADGYSRLAHQILRQQDEAHASEDRLVRKMDALNSVVLGRLDVFTDRMETIWRESKTLPQVIDAQGRQLGDHEARIKSLEGRTS